MRLKYTLRNMLWNTIGQLVLILSGLLLKKILLDTIGTEKVGLNYVFNDLVGLLAIAELGITNIIAFHLYKPLLAGDENAIIRIMRFFRKVYVAIGASVIVLGFAVMPFLGVILGKTDLDYRYIIIVFILFLLRDMEGYFFSYKSILPYADQKSYIVLIVDTITSIAHTVLSVFVIIYTKNFIYVMILEIIRKIVKDTILNHIINQRYPYIKKQFKGRLERAEAVKIRQEISQAFIGKVSDMIISTSDNIMITMFLGLRITGLFSNYTLVLYTVQTMLRQLLSSAQAGIGNLLVTDQGEAVYSVIRKMTFIAFYITAFCGCCLSQLTTPFVALYFGKQYMLGRAIVLICISNIFLDILQRTMVQLADAGGLFRYTKRINLTSCIINIILSLIGVRLFGIAGILLGTLISRSIEFFLRIRINFNLILKISYLGYLKAIIGYIIIFALEVELTYVVCRFIPAEYPLLHFTVIGLISAVFPLLINHFVFRLSEEYSYMKELFHLLIKGILEKLGRRLNEENS